MKPKSLSKFEIALARARETALDEDAMANLMDVIHTEGLPKHLYQRGTVERIDQNEPAIQDVLEGARKGSYDDMILLGLLVPYWQASAEYKEVRAMLQKSKEVRPHGLAAFVWAYFYKSMPERLVLLKERRNQFGEDNYAAFVAVMFQNHAPETDDDPKRLATHYYQLADLKESEFATLQWENGVWDWKFEDIAGFWRPAKHRFVNNDSIRKRANLILLMHNHPACIMYVIPKHVAIAIIGYVMTINRALLDPPVKKSRLVPDEWH